MICKEIKTLNGRIQNCSMVDDFTPLPGFLKIKLKDGSARIINSQCVVEVITGETPDDCIFHDIDVITC